MDSSGNMTPAALIPFCAYQTDMLLVGHSLLSTNNQKEGRNNGLLIILDLGTPEDNGKTSSSGKSNQSNNFIRLETLSPKTSHARIYLNMLSSFSAYRAGSYGMTALKQMTGTSSFMKLSDDGKGYIKEVMKECGCVPSALADALEIKDPIFCAPNASTCYTAVSKNTYSCMVSSTGLCADVQFTEDRILAKDNKNSKEEDKEKLKHLFKEHKRYKTDYAQNIKFDPNLKDLGN